MRKKERRQDRGHITTEAESGHHVSCSDFTLTDHFSRFALKFHLHVHNSRFKFTLGFIVRDSLSAQLTLKNILSVYKNERRQVNKKSYEF